MKNISTSKIDQCIDGYDNIKGRIKMSNDNDDTKEILRLIDNEIAKLKELRVSVDALDIAINNSTKKE